MFFDTWWQGIIFGAVTTVALLAIGYAFTVMWRPYEDEKKQRFAEHHDDHHGDHGSHGSHDAHGCHAHH